MSISKDLLNEALELCADLKQHGMYYTMYLYPSADLIKKENFSVFYDSYVEPDKVTSEFAIYHKFVGSIVSNYSSLDLNTIKNIVMGYDFLFNEEPSCSHEIDEFDVSDEYSIYFKDRLEQLKNKCLETDLNLHFHSIISIKINNDLSNVETGLALISIIKPPSETTSLKKEDITTDDKKGVLFASLSLIIADKASGESNPFANSIRKSIILESMLLR